MVTVIFYDLRLLNDQHLIGFICHRKDCIVKNWKIKIEYFVYGFFLPRFTFPCFLNLLSAKVLLNASLYLLTYTRYFLYIPFSLNVHFFSYLYK